MLRGALLRADHSCVLCCVCVCVCRVSLRARQRVREEVIFAPAATDEPNRGGCARPGSSSQSSRVVRCVAWRVCAPCAHLNYLCRHCKGARLAQRVWWGLAVARGVCQRHDGARVCGRRVLAAAGGGCAREVQIELLSSPVRS